MKKVTVGVLTSVFVCLMTTNVFALSINDAGVVGTIDTQEGSNVPNELAWSQYLLDLGQGVVDHPFDANGNGTDELYNTNASFDYDGSLTGGTKVDGGGLDASGFDYALAKYDGPNAGYVLFDLSVFGTTLPQFPADLWTNNPDQYALSHFTGFIDDDKPVGELPEPGTVLLIGSSLAGFGLWRLGRKQK